MLNYVLSIQGIQTYKSVKSTCPSITPPRSTPPAHASATFINFGTFPEYLRLQLTAGSKLSGKTY